jgi:hypothetical protein
MSMEPDMRAGDQDRDAAISHLREAFAEGRLSNDEFEQRLDRVHAARTYGELTELVSDLPTGTSPAIPAPVAEVPAERDDDHDVRNGWAAWAGVSAMVNVIYFATWMTSGGSAPYYWPIWVMGPWGAAMLIGTLSKRD